MSILTDEIFSKKLDKTNTMLVKIAAQSRSKPAAFDEAPLMDGAAGPGEAAEYARGDHVHPHDSTKVDKTDYNPVAATSSMTQAVGKDAGGRLFTAPFGGAAEQWEPIETIRVGYTVTASEPADWSSNWTDYYISTGTARQPVYTAVTGATAPTWAVGTYYSYNAAGTGTIDRATEPDGTAYSFKKLLVMAESPAGHTGSYGLILSNTANLFPSAATIWTFLAMNSAGGRIATATCTALGSGLFETRHYATRAADSTGTNGTENVGGTVTYLTGDDEIRMLRIKHFNGLIPGDNVIRIWGVRV